MANMRTLITILLLISLLLPIKPAVGFEDSDAPRLGASAIDADTGENRINIGTRNILVTADIPSEIFKEEGEELKVDLRVKRGREVIFVLEGGDFSSRSTAGTQNDEGGRTKTDYLFSLGSPIEENDRVEICFTLLPSGRGGCGAFTVMKDMPDNNTSSQVSSQVEGRDMSELMLGTASEKLEPGDLIAVSAERISAYGISIIKSTQVYQKGLIGVISTEPGMTLGKGLPETEDYKSFPLALMGTVPAKVSTENGPIEIGDPITSSAIPGVGMKATGAGRVVGMALESYNNQEVGKIMVLVNSHWVGYDLSVQENGEGQIVNLSPEELRAGLASLGLEILTDGTLMINKVRASEIEITSKIEIGSSGKPTGITIYDEETGEAYCIKMKGGEMVYVPGKCEVTDSTATDSTTVTSTSTPETIIDTHPEALTTSIDATFTFLCQAAENSSLPDCTFQCQINNQGFIPCISPKEYVNLTSGEYLFEVFAVDPLGKYDPTPATFSWTIEGGAQPEPESEPEPSATIPETTTTTPTTTPECQTQTFYLDSDSDNYGNPLVATSTCEQPTGYVADNTDCNNSDPNINPTAIESCDDNIDNNCSGEIDEGCLIEEATSTEPTTTTPE